MTSRYDDLLRILTDADVTTPEALLRLTPSLNAVGVTYIGSDRYGWVTDIFSFYQTHFHELLDAHKTLSAPRLLVNRPYGAFNVHSWSVSDRLFLDRDRYSCLFPGRALFLSHQFITDEEDGTIYIPLDFLPSALALTPLLPRGFAHLLPTRLVNKDERWYSHELVGTYHYKTGHDAPIELANSGDNADTLHESVAACGTPEPNALLIPWLNGASLEDFISLAENHPDEFKLYNRALEKFFKDELASERLLREWLQELDDSITQLDVKCRLEARKLRSRGLDIAVGLAATLAVLIVPFTPEVKAAVGGLFSSKAAYDGLRWIIDYKRLPDQLSDQRYWALWRLSRGVKRPR